MFALDTNDNLSHQISQNKIQFWIKRLSEFFWLVPREAQSSAQQADLLHRPQSEPMFSVNLTFPPSSTRDTFSNAAPLRISSNWMSPDTCSLVWSRNDGFSIASHLMGITPEVKRSSRAWLTERLKLKLEPRQPASDSDWRPHTKQATKLAKQPFFHSWCRIHPKRVTLIPESHPLQKTSTEDCTDWWLGRRYPVVPSECTTCSPHSWVSRVTTSRVPSNTPCACATRPCVPDPAATNTWARSTWMDIWMHASYEWMDPPLRDNVHH